MEEQVQQDRTAHRTDTQARSSAVSCAVCTALETQMFSLSLATLLSGFVREVLVVP